MNIIFLTFFTLLPILSLAQSEVKIKGSESYQIDSNIIGEKLNIDVYLPWEYDSSIAYPVVYITDSEYNFGGVSYISRRLMKNKDIPKVILVGISYGGTYKDYYNKRARDLTPYKTSKKRFPDTGKADRFVKFLKEELFPFVGKKFKVIEEDKTLYGHSFGGLFGQYVLFKYPKLFKRVISLSPSLWYKDKKIFEEEELFAKKNSNLPVVFFSAVGGLEPSYFVKDWMDMVRKIVNKKYKGLSFRHRLYEGENHRSIFGVAFTDGIRYVFQKK